MTDLNFPNTPLGFEALKENLPSATINNLTIGKYWILIETHYGAGLVATPPQPNRSEIAQELHVVKGQPTDKIIDLCYSQNSLKRAIGCATINSLINTINLDLSLDNGLNVNAKADEKIVIVVSDANFRRYGISAKDLKEAMEKDSTVVVHLILIASLRDEAREITARLPAGRVHICFDNTELPMVIRKILTANTEIY